MQIKFASSYFHILWIFYLFSSILIKFLIIHNAFCNNQAKINQCTLSQKNYCERGSRIRFGSLSEEGKLHLHMKIWESIVHIEIWIIFEIIEMSRRRDSIEYAPRAKWRRGWHKLKTLVGTFTILSYAKNFLLIFLSIIVSQSALYIFEM